MYTSAKEITFLLFAQLLISFVTGNVLKLSNENSSSFTKNVFHHWKATKAEILVQCKGHSILKFKGIFDTQKW